MCSFICRAGIANCKKEKAASELERVQQSPGTKSYRATCESNEEDGGTAPVWFSVTAPGAPVVCEEEYSPSFTVELSDFPNSKVRIGFDIMVILKGRQQPSWLLKKKLKAAEVEPELMKVLPTVTETSVVVLDDVDDINQDPHAEE